MSFIKSKIGLISSAVLIGMASSAHAETLAVDCGGKIGLTSINAALKALQHSESHDPATITVSGACHENVVIKDFSFLTIAGVNGASITDASDGAADVFDIRGSRVTITGMTIDGLRGVNNDAVDCEQASQCTLIGNTILGGADVVGIFSLSSAIIVGGVIQDGTSDGILAIGDVIADGVKVKGNPVGVIVRRGGRASLGVAEPGSVPIPAITQSNIANNATGILVAQGAEISCAACIIKDNTGDGLHIDVSAAATIQGATLANGATILPVVTHNSGYGVYLGDLSSATFHGASTVTGNGQRDILCNSPTSVTRGALAAAGDAANTNCSN